MKYFKILLIVLVFPLIASAPNHKFYVSITKVEYVKEKNSLQLITKIFIDDLEAAIQKHYDPSVVLGTKKETEAEAELLKKYILDKITVKINGKAVQLNYLGKEYTTDMLVAYIEVEKVASLQTIEIENKMLMELFPEQQNIIHVKTPTNRKSLILDRDESAGYLEFND